MNLLSKLHRAITSDLAGVLIVAGLLVSAAMWLASGKTEAGILLGLFAFRDLTDVSRERRDRAYRALADARHKAVVAGLEHLGLRVEEKEKDA